MRHWKLLFACSWLLACSGPMPTGTAGTGGTSGRDNPFGVDPTYCDENPGAGGDACDGRLSGFAPIPAHGSTQLALLTRPGIAIRFDFTPSTALKRAVEQNIGMRATGSDFVRWTRGEWVVEGKTLRYLLDLGGQPLTPGSYTLTLGQPAWLAFYEPYRSRYPNPVTFTYEPFPKLPDGDPNGYLQATFELK